MAAPEKLNKLFSSFPYKEETLAIEKIASRILKSLEERRGQPFSFQYHHKKFDEIRSTVSSKVSEVRRQMLSSLEGDFDLPTRPTKEIDQYEGQCQRYEQLIYRNKIDADDPSPQKPSQVANYERQVRELKEIIVRESIKSGHYWLSDERQYQIENSTKELLLRTVRRPVDRLKPFNSTPVESYSPLVGEDFFSHRIADHANVIGSEKVQSLVPLDLVFLEGLRKGTKNFSLVARESESWVHNQHVRNMVGLLIRLGYEVYPGDVGIRGTFAMADLLAVKGQDYLFVECLTDWAIKEKSHIKKMKLAENVPFLFVGKLPVEFLQILPSNAYAIESPFAHKMHNDEWIPYFWRTTKQTMPELSVRPKGRTGRTFFLNFDGLVMQEDTSGFLGQAITQLLRRSEISLGGIYRVPPLPFDRHGKAGSAFHIRNKLGPITIRLGKVPALVECNEPKAMELLLTHLCGLGLKVSG